MVGMTCWMFQNMYEAVTDPTKELLAEDTQVEILDQHTNILVQTQRHGT